MGVIYFTGFQPLLLTEGCEARAVSGFAQCQQRGTRSAETRSSACCAEQMSEWEEGKAEGTQVPSLPPASPPPGRPGLAGRAPSEDTVDAWVVTPMLHHLPAQCRTRCFLYLERFSFGHMARLLLILQILALNIPSLKRPSLTTVYTSDFPAHPSPSLCPGFFRSSTYTIECSFINSFIR